MLYIVTIESNPEGIKYHTFQDFDQAQDFYREKETGSINDHTHVMKLYRVDTDDDSNAQEMIASSSAMLIEDTDEAHEPNVEI